MISKIQGFIEAEMRSCSMDIGGITPLYVYRMWGGQESLREIEQALKFQESCSMVKGQG